MMSTLLLSLRSLPFSGRRKTTKDCSSETCLPAPIWLPETVLSTSPEHDANEREKVSEAKKGRTEGGRREQTRFGHLLDEHLEHFPTDVRRVLRVRDDHVHVARQRLPSSVACR